jgi:hypothetical protein
MSRNLPLQDLRQKIQELETALFFVLSNELLKMPVRIIRAIFVDDLSQIWFLLPMPTQSVKEFSPVFLAKLDFFRKQKEYSLSVTGKAFFVSDPEELNNADGIPLVLVRRAVQGEAVLVKFKIQHIDYQENKPVHPDLVLSWKTEFKHHLARVLSFLPRLDFPILKESLFIRIHQIHTQLHKWRSQQSHTEMKGLDKILLKKSSSRQRRETIPSLHES